MKFPLSAKTTVTFERPLSPKATQTRSGTLPSNPRLMLPPEAQKKMQAWIRSRHLICEGNFFVFATVDFPTIERFSDCVKALGGTVISVEPINKVWIGQRQVLLYQAKASLHTPHHNLKQYWWKYGSFNNRFEAQT
ncbi:MAG: CpeR family transcriptional regulator [Leptolyngbyaceae cyanobacterium]